jgi:hypothetical protein
MTLLRGLSDVGLHALISTRRPGSWGSQAALKRSLGPAAQALPVWRHSGTLAHPSTLTLVGLIERFKAWRAAKNEDRAAIARALQEERRAGDEPPKSLSETVENAAGEFPPLG